MNQDGLWDYSDVLELLCNNNDKPPLTQSWRKRVLVTKLLTF